MVVSAWDVQDSSTSDCVLPLLECAAGAHVYSGCDLLFDEPPRSTGATPIALRPVTPRFGDLIFHGRPPAMISRDSTFIPSFRRLLQFLLVTFLVMALVIGREISTEAQRFVFGQREVQIFVPYSGESPVTLPPVLIVAHNAGDQESTVRKAFEHGATAIEIDVRSVAGILYATHSNPPEMLPLRLWRVPRLYQAWGYSGKAEALKLDLKSTDQHALESLVQFIEARPSDRQIIISSSDRDALAYLDAALPDTLEFLSVSTGLEIDTLLQTKGRIDGVDGLSIPAWVLSDERILLLLEHGYLIDAWAVNDVARLIELTSLGVDIVTTDNLAFFDMLVDTPPEASLDEIAQPRSATGWRLDVLRGRRTSLTIVAAASLSGTRNDRTAPRKAILAAAR